VYTDVSFIKLLIVSVVLGLSGCSSNPNYNKATSCGSLTPLCLATVAAVDLVTNEGGSSRNCSEMTGEERKECVAQVESLKKHIKDASNK